MAAAKEGNDISSSSIIGGGGTAAAAEMVAESACRSRAEAEKELYGCRGNDISGNLPEATEAAAHSGLTFLT